MSGERYQQLTAWLAPILPGCESQALGNDASFRRYYRVSHQDKPYVIMDAPPALESCDAFIKVQGLLTDLGVRVPMIHARDEAQGFLLLSDMGDKRLQEQLSADNATQLYHAAMRSLIIMQQGAQVAKNHLPHFNQNFIHEELMRFQNWYIEKYLGLTLEKSDRDLLQSCFAFLNEILLMQPQSWVHRDYHSRNLMVLDEQDIGVLDFQDAMYGPVVYDLVSLLRDCYISWPVAQVREWALWYREQAIEAGVLMKCEELQFLRWFDLTGVQRHLKAVGIFARLHLRDGKSHYMGDVPRALSYVHQLITAYPELAGLAQILKKIEKQ